MTQRYQIIELAHSFARVVDTHTQELVRTNSGTIYEAPIENAQWTADRLNTREEEIAILERPDVQEPELETYDFVTPTSDELEWTPAPKLDSYDFETQAENGLSQNKAEAVVFLDSPRHARPETPAKPRSEFALAWDLGAYRSANTMALKRLRKALKLTAGDDYRLRMELESAIGALEAGEETVSENPFN